MKIVSNGNIALIKEKIHFLINSNFVMMIPIIVSYNSESGATLNKCFKTKKIKIKKQKSSSYKNIDKKSSNENIQQCFLIGWLNNFELVC